MYFNILKIKLYITFEVYYVKNIVVLPVTTSRPITTLSSGSGSDSGSGSGTAAQITTTTSTTTTSAPAAGKFWF